MIGREVVVFVLSVAVAAVVVALAVRMLPGAGQLAYGSPMPVFKVAYSGGAVQLWVEDFAGVPYQRAYFYVDGRYVGSQPPGGRITVRCGDRVAALVQYPSGVKEVNGTVMCAKPARAPGGAPQTWDTYSVTMLYAYQIATGDLERTGLPVSVTGGFDPYDYGDCSHEWVRFTALNDSILCSGWTCQGSFFYIGFGRRATFSFDVYKIPDKAVASQYLGGAHAVFNVWIDSWGNTYYMYVNGALIATCTVQSDKYSYMLTTYKRANASGVYMTKMWWPGGQVFEGTLAVWQRPDGNWGFQTWLNPIEGAQAPPLNSNGQCTAIDNGSVPITIPTRYGPLCAEFNLGWGIGELFDRGPLYRFIDYIKSNNDARTYLSDSLKNMQDVSYNVPQIAENYTYTIAVTRSEVWSTTKTFSFTILMPASLGAVFATSVLPVDVQIPPAAAPNKTAPVVGPIGGSNTTASSLYQELLINSRYMQSYVVNYGK